MLPEINRRWSNIFPSPAFLSTVSLSRCARFIWPRPPLLLHTVSGAARQPTHSESKSNAHRRCFCCFPFPFFLQTRVVEFEALLMGARSHLEKRSQLAAASPLDENYLGKFTSTLTRETWPRFYPQFMTRATATVACCPDVLSEVAVSSQIICCSQVLFKMRSSSPLNKRRIRTACKEQWGVTYRRQCQ